MQWHSIHLVAASIIDSCDGSLALIARLVCRAWHEAVEYLGAEADMWPRLLFAAAPYLRVQRRLLAAYVPWYVASRRITRQDVFPVILAPASAAPAIGRMALSLAPRAPLVDVLIVTQLFEGLAWLTHVPLTATLDEVLTVASQAFPDSSRFGFSLSDEGTGVRWSTCGMGFMRHEKLSDLRPSARVSNRAQSSQSRAPQLGLRSEILLVGGAAAFATAFTRRSDDEREGDEEAVDALAPVRYTATTGPGTGRHMDACVM